MEMGKNMYLVSEENGEEETVIDRKEQHLLLQHELLYFV